MQMKKEYDEEAYKWLLGNDLSYDIWNNKYRYNNESFNEWINRVSGKEDDIAKLILEKKFLFGGRILANRGLDKLGKRITLSNCYVLSKPEDNIESIFECGKKLARTYSYGGGCGVDVSNLRPKNSKVNNAAKTTSGCVSFMDFFSYVTGLIGQAGRRGALMLSIDCTHPDLEEFINLKTNLNICTKANISVRISDAFMKAVENDEDWLLSFTINGDEKITKTVKAKKIFKLLAQRNWEMAEPGVLFWDNICNYNMLNEDKNFSYAGTNPCAEEPLPGGGSCLLGSMNLSEFVKNPFTKNASVDYDALEEATVTSIRALNRVLIEGMKLHPLKEQQESVYNWKQIGLGTMGLGDMLIKLGIIYGSSESISIINSVFKTIATTSVETSLELAKIHGCYPMCNKKALANSSFIKNLNLPISIIDDIKEYGLFNSQLLTCAPTGSIGTMFQVSTGVEPNYAFSFNRRTVSLNSEETTYKVEADIVKQYRSLTSDKNEKLPPYFVASETIEPLNRVKVQGALQKWIDASISSTVNLKESATVEDVYDIYYNAWKEGLKGITIYRNNCQRQGILTTESKKTKPQISSAATSGNSSTELLRGEIRKNTNSCIGLKRTLTTGCGSLHVEAFFDTNTGDLVETYLSKGSKGGCNNFMIGLSRMITLAAKAGVSLDDIIDQLRSCGTCPSYAVRSAVKKDTSKGSCCPVAVGNALIDMSKEMKNRFVGKIVDKASTQKKSKTAKPEDTTVNNDEDYYEECPQCHEKTLIHSGGCVQCSSCGWSKCN